MQQRLNDMNPMMFGDTIRLPVFNTKQNFNITAQAAAATPEPAKWRSGFLSRLVGQNIQKL